MISYINSKKKENVDIAFVEAPEVSSNNNTNFIDMSDNYTIVQKNRLLEYTGSFEDNKVILRLDKQEYPFLKNLLNITNIEKDGVPLFFKYKLKYLVNRYIVTEKQFFIYDAITNEIAEDIVYKFYPLQIEDEVFQLYIFFDKAYNIFERYYLYYIDSNGSEHKEYIYPEFAYYYSKDAKETFDYSIVEDKGDQVITINTIIDNDIIFIDFTGYNKITIKEIPNKNRDNIWTLYIKNGFFEIDNISEARLKFIYSLKEFDEQIFNHTLGAPYKNIKEQPRINDDKLFLSYSLLAPREPINIYVNDILFWTLSDIRHVDKINGIIKLPKKLSINSKIEIEYTAIIDYIEYTGYYDFNSYNRLNFNMNPCKGNKMSYISQSNELIEKPVFQTMTYPVYIYLKPSYTYYCDKIINNQRLDYLNSLNKVTVTSEINYIVIDLSNAALTTGFCEMKKELTNELMQRKANNHLEAGVVYWTFDNDNTNVNTAIRIYNSNLLRGQTISFTYVISDSLQLSYLNEGNSIFHTMDKISNEECLTNGYLLLGEIYCFPNSTISDLTVIDLRKRGGGITEELKDEIRREIEPESDFYWDIGFWDGEEFSDMALCFRIDESILEQNGGKIKKETIQEAIEKHIALGTDYMIEYININDHVAVRKG